MNVSDKYLDGKIRRTVCRVGLKAMTSRKDFGPDNLGGYRLIDLFSNRILARDKDGSIKALHNKAITTLDMALARENQRPSQ